MDKCGRASGTRPQRLHQNFWVEDVGVQCLLFLISLKYREDICGKIFRCSLTAVCRSKGNQWKSKRRRVFDAGTRLPAISRGWQHWCLQVEQSKMSWWWTVRSCYICESSGVDQLGEREDTRLALCSVKRMTADHDKRQRTGGQTPVCDAFTHLCRIEDVGRSLNVIRLLIHITGEKMKWGCVNFKIQTKYFEEVTKNDHIFIMFSSYIFWLRSGGHCQWFVVISMARFRYHPHTPLYAFTVLTGSIYQF